MKKPMKITLICIGLLLVGYLATCLYISSKVNNLVKASYNSYGENNVYQDIISDKLFDWLSYRRKETRGQKNNYEKNWRSFPVTILYFDKAVSRHWYSYKNSFGGSAAKHFPVIVTLNLKNFKWIVTDVHENP